MNHTLKFPRLWQACGWLMVALVIWLSLIPSPPQPPEFLAWDKAQHFLAYGILMYWFGQVCRRHWRWPLLLVTLGVSLEFIQAHTGRYFDIMDMLANSLGVALGLIVSLYVPLPGLFWLDSCLDRMVERCAS